MREGPLTSLSGKRALFIKYVRNSTSLYKSHPLSLLCKGSLPRNDFAFSKRKGQENVCTCTQPSSKRDKNQRNRGSSSLYLARRFSFHSSVRILPEKANANMYNKTSGNMCNGNVREDVAYGFPTLIRQEKRGVRNTHNTWLKKLCS